MAPASAAVESGTSGQKSKSSLRQLRKPVVEKLRRDRINSSIKQLRLLLENIFKNDQPDSKLEKADILEMTVNYLKQRRLLVHATSTPVKSPFQDYSRGYHQCLEETLQYLSYSEKMGPANQKVMQHFNRGHATGRKAPAASPPISEQPPKHVIWRPW